MLRTCQNPQEGNIASRVQLTRKLFHALDESSISWVIRGLPGELFRWCRARTRKDLDIWIPAKDMEKAVAIVISHGGIPVCTRKGYMGRTWLRTVIVVFIELDGTSLAMLDLNFGQPATGLIRLLSDEAYYKESIIRRSGWPYLSGGAALTDIFVRRLLRGKQFSPSWILHLRRIWKKMSVDERDVWIGRTRKVFNAYIIKQLQDILDSNMDHPSYGWKYFYYSMLFVYFYQRPGLLLGTICDVFFWGSSPRRRDINPAGAKPSALTVAVIGTDGTGKSTLTTRLTRNLKGFTLSCEKLYFGRVRGGIFLGPVLQGIFGFFFGKKEPVEHAADPSENMSRFEKAVRWIGSFYYVFDYLTRFLFLVVPKLIKRYTVIYDRYVYDLYIMPGSCNFAAWLIEKLAPRPHVLCYLDAGVDVIMSRRDERTREEALRQQIIFGEVAKRTSKGRILITVPGFVGAHDSGNQITRICITQIFRKQIQNKKIISMLIEDVQKKLLKNDFQ